MASSSTSPRSEKLHIWLRQPHHTGTEDRYKRLLASQLTAPSTCTTRRLDAPVSPFAPFSPWGLGVLEARPFSLWCSYTKSPSPSGLHARSNRRNHWGCQASLAAAAPIPIAKAGASTMATCGLVRSVGVQACPSRSISGDGVAASIPDCILDSIDTALHSPSIRRASISRPHGPFCCRRSRPAHLMNIAATASIEPRSTPSTPAAKSWRPKPHHR
jgi:hypothetical protein